MVFRSTRDIMRFSCITCISLPVGFVVLVTCMVDCPHPKALLETAGLGGYDLFSIGTQCAKCRLKVNSGTLLWWNHRILKAIFIVMMHNVDYWSAALRLSIQLNVNNLF